MRLRIRIKLLAAFGSILLLSILLIIFSAGSINRILYFKGINEDVDILKLRLDAMDLAYKSFLYEGYKSKMFLEKHTVASIDMFAENYKEAKEKLNRIDPQQAALIRVELDSLQKDFVSLVDLLQRRGFKDFGLEGSLRKAIHSVENSGFDFDKAAMLMLRRHEKDFFLRRDLRYQDEFNKRFDDFRAQLQSKTGAELLAYLDNYKAEFNNVVEIEKQIGLSETEGIRGHIQTSFQSIRPRIEIIRDSVKEENEEQIATTKWILWIIFALQITAGIAMALLYAGIFTKSIKEIRGGMLQLAAGVFPEKLKILTTEEIGQTKMAFNQFIDRLKAATTFAEQLGAGQLAASYDERYADDVLARSLLNAREKLRHADADQRRINRINEGTIRFNEVLKNDAENIYLLGDHILKLLVSYVTANQGALYILKGSASEGTIERIATYAYEKKKFVSQSFEAGTGLVGQCILEGETIYLKSIPREYTKITSGLGEASPRNVVIVPLKTAGNVMGALELASFHLLEEQHIEFIEKTAENIANLLVNKQRASEMMQLLQESKQKAVMLTQQEEIMRQHAEELQATQEEMERQRAGLQQEINRLKAALVVDVLEEV